MLLSTAPHGAHGSGWRGGRGPYQHITVPHFPPHKGLPALPLPRPRPQPLPLPLPYGPGPGHRNVVEEGTGNLSMLRGARKGGAREGEREGPREDVGVGGCTPAPQAGRGPCKGLSWEVTHAGEALGRTWKRGSSGLREGRCTVAVKPRAVCRRCLQAAAGPKHW